MTTFTTTGSDLIRQHKQLADQAYQAISAGIDKEETTHDAAGALELYWKGVRDLRAALAMPFTTRDDREKAQSLNLKLHNNLKQIEERIRTLTAAQKTAMPSSTSARYTAVSRSNSASLSTSDRHGAGDASNNVSIQQQATNKPILSQLKGIDTTMAHKILNEVLDAKPNVAWDDVVGLDAAKQALREIVVLPAMRPELFTGLRAPARGVLLFGPPGTGKTMLAKAVSHESKATFFSISASSLTSKFVGESEKMVRTLFAMARQLQPSVIFIDEIDSILTERSENENEASRRLKTEFLLQFDGISTSATDRLLVMGATNRPQELDEAALRRLVKRIYIPLPEPSTRYQLIIYLLKGHKHAISDSDIMKIVTWTDGYSASDITALAREASLGPIRSLGEKIVSTPADQIRPMLAKDFGEAIQVIRPSVSRESLAKLESWNREYGVTG
ncbi:hypothetical protein SeLEV6574_g05997 [Synchytrium endobioticum]|uniref:microtubule-severing ATPase n=1 Tax=Synchytrium endobioticum TaxID=286115 RepID=A0A507CR38_9FUNG|nr:hypothetical protein SeLEV6574_g05997 [Synchytrium endobioticum]